MIAYRTKKWVGLWLVLILLLVACPMVVFASPATTVSIPDAAAPPGATVTVPINITDVTDLGAVDIWLYYRDKIVIVDSVANGDLGPITVGIDNTAGVTKMNWFSPTIGGSGDFVFAYVTLHAVGDPGDTSTLDLDVKEMVDTSAVPISHDVDDGLFTLGALLMEGDVYQDGRVSIADPMLIALYMVGLRELDANQLESADTTDDGKVNMSDVMHIAQWLVDPDGTLGILFKPLWESPADDHMRLPEARVPVTAADIPELADHVARGQVWGHLEWNPFEHLLLKPDGTPFKIAYGVSTIEVEPMAQAVYMMEDWFPRMGLGPKGENWTTYGAEFNVEKQIAWVEDMTITFKPDIMMIHSADEELMVPAAQNAVLNCITVFTLDCGINKPSTLDSSIQSPAITSFIAHKFEGPGGTDILGEWLVDELLAKGYGPENPVVVGEMWGMREMVTAQRRHVGFHKAIDKRDWITVIESADTNWAEELTATLVADMAIAHPEIKAFFHHGCGGAGMVPGLEGIGMLFPIEDPRHIIIVSNDAEIALWDAVIDGVADAFATHGGVEPTDICFQVAVTNVVLGQWVEPFYQCPYIMVTRDNIDFVQIGGVPPYPGWPRGRWDVWLPADPMEYYGFPQPSLELRMQYMGY